VRQLDAVASRFLTGLVGRAPMLRAGGDGLILLDVDDTIIEVQGYAKQGAGFGYSRVRGLNALLATVSAAAGAPVIVAQRLLKGSCGSPRGAALAGGADVSITVRLDPSVTKAIATIAPHAWTTIEYPDAIRDDATGQWISRSAELFVRTCGPPTTART
jgi:hypothetical protein